MNYKILSFVLFLSVFSLFSQSESEEEYYAITTIPKNSLELEIGGMATLPNGDLAVCTRKGDVYIIQNPYLNDHMPANYIHFARGLHEPLGLAYHNGNIYCAQRGELTKLVDTNADGIADKYETVIHWSLSGHYHEYSYGPYVDQNNDMYLTFNVAFGNPDWWNAKSLAKYRGWLVKLSKDGDKLEPIAAGIRSPVGLFINNKGDIFYSENQGDWVGSGWITHLEKGDFAGNPAGLVWTDEKDSPLKLKIADVASTDAPMFEAKENEIPSLKLPAIWFPHSLMGQSLSHMVQDNTSGKFGPFTGQLFIGDQAHSKIMRATFETINGEYQGACYPFVEGFRCGVLRTSWGIDGSLFVGETDRGWSSMGKENDGIQRVIWKGKVPFEMKEIKLKPDGFEIEFTKPVDKKTINGNSFTITSFTYKYHEHYGSPIINQEVEKVRGFEISEDGLKVRIAVENLRQYYVHEVKLDGIVAKDSTPVLHNVAYYTINNFPKGDKMVIKEEKPMYMHAHHHHAMPMVAKPSKKTIVSQTEKHITKMPKDWNGKSDYSFSISTKPGLQYDIKELTVKAGSKVSISFSNPDDMMHNLVVVNPGTAMEVGNLALAMGLSGPNKSYVPDSKDVLFHSNLVGPGGNETIFFVAPSTLGNYTYVCTYPGHAAIMQGTLKVTP